MRDIRTQKFWTLSNMDRIIAYLYSREGGYVTARSIERACNISTGEASSYIKWLMVKGVVKRKKSKLQTHVHYFYSFDKLPFKKEYIKNIVIEKRK